MRSHFVESFFLLFVSVLPLEIQLSRGEGGNSITQLTQPHFCVCPKPGHGFSKPYVVVFYILNALWWDNIILICWYWWNCWPLLIRLSLHINVNNAYNSVSVFWYIRDPSWTWSYSSCIYNYLCNHCLLPLKLWVRILWTGVLSLSLTCGRSVVSLGYSGFLHRKNLLPRYSWNIVESDVKHP
jgi:hypothetical protein